MAPGKGSRARDGVGLGRETAWPVRRPAWFSQAELRGERRQGLRSFRPSPLLRWLASSLALRTDRVRCPARSERPEGSQVELRQPFTHSE